MKFLSLPSGKIINLEKIALMEPGVLDGKWWVFFIGDAEYPKSFDSADAKVIQGKIFQ